MSINAVASSDSMNAILAASNQKPMSEQNSSPTAGTLLEISDPLPVDKPEEITGTEIKKVDQEIPKDDERISSRLAAIAREKRLLFEREQKLKIDREEFEEYKKAKQNAKEDPLGFLEKSGLKLEDVIYSGLGSKPEKTDQDRIKELYDRFEKKEEEEKAAREKYEQEKITNSINNFKNDINKHIEANSEKYELITLKNAQHEVYSLIETWLQKTTEAAEKDPTGETKPQLMSIQEAADKIEEYYEQHESEIFSKSKKLASKYAQKDTPKPTPVSPTLTNKNSVNTTAANPQETYINFEHRREASIKRSAQLLQELLNKRQ